MIEDKFKNSRIAKYDELRVENLVILFIQDHPKTEFSKMRRYTCDFTETFGQFRVEELTTGVLKTWMDQIEKEGNLKKVSMRGIKSDLDIFFRYLIDKEVISESPLAPIYYQKEVPDITARNILSRNQIYELSDSAKSYSPGYAYPIIKTFAETAAKLGEIVDLNWQNVDFNSKELIFHGTIKSQPRRLKISDELINILEKKKKPSGYVFLTYYKEPFTKKKLTRLMNEVKIKTKCPYPWSLMDFRHSFAVNYLRSRGDIKKLQYILGHNNVFDTRRLYSEAQIKNKSVASEVSPFEVGS